MSRQGGAQALRVLAVHNYYREPGGEDAVFADEVRLLRQHGHEVVEFTETNSRISSLTAINAARTALWSTPSYDRIRDLINEHHPDVAHFHNTWLMVSPSAYYACNELGVPVVQTLHNYRLSCPSAAHFRDGRVCEECLGRDFAWPGVLHACYRRSRPQSAVVAAMTAFHRVRRTWAERVDTYIALTEFGRRKFVEAGLPAEKIVVKPNFVFESAIQTESRWPGEMALFFGRLSTEKGVSLLLEAWEGLQDVPLTIAGNGPLRGEVEQLAERQPSVRYVGQRSQAEVLGLVRRARFVVVPSVCFEGFPRAIVESYACGKPVVASRLGAMEELVQHGGTGYLFTAGSSTDLRTTTLQLWRDTSAAQRMGEAGRGEFEARYTPDRNHEQLMDIYHTAIQAAARDGAHHPRGGQRL